MTDAPLDSAGGPDWTINLNQTPRGRRTDPRLPVVRDAVQLAESQLQSLMTLLQSMEVVIRDCAANGITPDEIAEQCSLTREAVDRVLSGRTLFDFPPR